MPLLALFGLLGAQTVGPKTFSSAEEARDALIQTATNGSGRTEGADGIEIGEILRTGDAIADKQLFWTSSSGEVAEKAQLEPDPDECQSRHAADWRSRSGLCRTPDAEERAVVFRHQEGKAEIRRRSIGAMNSMPLRSAEATWKHRKCIPRPIGTRTACCSTPARSPAPRARRTDCIGRATTARFPKIRRAMAQGYPAPGGASKGYHGYLYKILLAQGSDALDGAQEYIVHGLMIGGFALVAWPIEYGVSGIMTFIVNQDGVVYEKDLGPQTGVIGESDDKVQSG